MIYKILMPFIICLVITLQSSVLLAAQNKYRGKVLKVNGDVEIVNVKGEKRLIKDADAALNEMDTIVTKNGGSVIVQFDDGVLSVLDEKSRLRVEKNQLVFLFRR